MSPGGLDAKNDAARAALGMLYGQVNHTDYLRFRS